MFAFVLSKITLTVAEDAEVHEAVGAVISVALREMF